MTWETLKLGDATEFIRNGKSVKQSKEVDGLPITRIETIWNSSIDTTRVGYAGLSEGEAKGYLLERGDILFSHINSLDHIGKCAMYSSEPEKLVHGMNLLCIRPKKGLMYSKFLTYLLRTKEFNGKLLSVTNKSVNQASVSTTNLKNISISLPPLEQQKRIAAILDKADELRAKRRRTIAKLDELLKSVFLELFGDPVTNPKGWPVMPFGDVCDTRLGKMLDAKQQTGQHLRLYLRNTNVQWNKVNLNEVFQMDFDESARRTLRLKHGDLLICEGGEAGRTAIWRSELEECYFQKAIHRARPDTKLAESEYLLFFMWFMLKNNGLKDFTTSATIAHLTGIKLKTVPVPLPPIELQRDFKQNFYRIEKIEALKNQHLTSAERLFASLQARAFSGDLTPDAVDEVEAVAAGS